MKKMLIVFGIVVAALLFSGTTKAVTYTCGTCASCTSAIAGASSGDTVQLNSSFVADNDECSLNGYCIPTKSGVTLDCQNYDIDGSGTTGCYYGIYSFSNAVIKNCVAHNFGYGFAAEAPSHNVTITDSKAYNNSWIGINVASSNNCTLTNLQVYDNGEGIIIDSGTGNILSNSVFHGNNAGGVKFLFAANNTVINVTSYDNFYGIRFYSAVNNIVNNSEIYNNSISAFRFEDSPNYSPNYNLIYNNIVNESSAFYSSNNSTAIINYFNTTPTAETNIVGGNRIGGNYWARPNGTGFSQVCNNTNADAFCDDALSFSGATDFLPLSLNYSEENETITPLIIDWITPINNSNVSVNSIVWSVNVSEPPIACLLSINGAANISMSIQSSVCSYTSTELNNLVTYCGQVFASDIDESNESSIQCATTEFAAFNPGTGGGAKPVAQQIIPEQQVPIPAAKTQAPFGIFQPLIDAIYAFIRWITGGLI